MIGSRHQGCGVRCYAGVAGRQLRLIRALLLFLAACGRLWHLGGIHGDFFGLWYGCVRGIVFPVRRGRARRRERAGFEEVGEGEGARKAGKRESGILQYISHILQSVQGHVRDCLPSCVGALEGVWPGLASCRGTQVYDNVCDVAGDA